MDLLKFSVATFSTETQLPSVSCMQKSCSWVSPESAPSRYLNSTEHYFL